MAADTARIEQVAHEFPDYQIAAQFIVGIDALERDNRKAVQWLSGVVQWHGDVAQHPFVQKYMAHVAFPVAIAPGVTVELPVSKDTAALMLGEALQGLGMINHAIRVVEGATPTSYAAVSLAELYSEQQRWDDVIDLTNNLTNKDDTTALLLALRGRAFRHVGHFDAAREALKGALRSKKRSREILHLALRERAESYADQGRKAPARKDLERILAEDAQAQGVRERLTELA